MTHTDVLYITPDDQDALREMFRWMKNRPPDRGREEVPRQLAQTPDVHVAKAPVGGIPALSGSTPGSAICELYTIDTEAPHTLKRWASDSHKVFNITTSRIPGGAWIAVHRSKKGEWITDTVSFDDEYYYLSSYGDIDDRASSVSFLSTINIECDGATGNLIGDVVEYTIISMIRGNRSSLSISVRVVTTDKILLEMECKTVMTNVTVSSAACVAGEISISLSKTFEGIRVPKCGTCE